LEKRRGELDHRHRRPVSATYAPLHDPAAAGVVWTVNTAAVLAANVRASMMARIIFFMCSAFSADLRRLHEEYGQVIQAANIKAE
jgi:hypothetical protein